MHHGTTSFRSDTATRRAEPRRAFRPLRSAVGLGAVVVIILGLPHRAPGQTLVLPTAAGSAEVPERLVDRLEDELRRLGEPVVLREEASERFEAEVSRPATRIQATELDWVAERAQRALLLVATGRNREAREAAQELLQRAERALEVLNREVDIATQVLDACLFAVRARLNASDPGRARDRAEECRRLVPDIEPDPYTHPPEVRELYAQVQEALGGSSGATLQVATPSPGCTVRLNGRPIGTTPLTLSGLPAGSYRVQLECSPESPGRVHHAMLQTGRTTQLEVNPRFEHALTTGPRLSLRYTNAPSAARRVEDARFVGQAARAADVWIVSAQGNGVRYDRVEVASGGHTTAVRTPLVPSDEVIAETAVFLYSERAELAAEPTANAPQTEPRAATTPSTGEPRKSSPWWGWALGITGLAALATSWGFYALVLERERQLDLAAQDDVDYQDRVDRLYDARIVTAATGWTGGTLLAFAMPLLLPEADGIPWWSWVAAAIGAAVVTSGIVLSVQTGDCLGASPGCFNQKQPWLLGTSLIAHALPFLAVPLVYGIRSTKPADLSPVVNLLPDGAFVGANGRF